MKALVVPAAKDNIQGYRFSGDKYSMKFCHPCTGLVFVAYRNAKQFYVIELATTIQKSPSECNFMHRVPLGNDASLPLLTRILRCCR